MRSLRSFLPLLLFLTGPILLAVPPPGAEGGEAVSEGEAGVQGPEPIEDSETAERAAGPVLHVRVDSIIHPVISEHLLEEIEAADEAGAQLLVVELNTPGGLVSSTREMFKGMLSARTPIVVWVGPSGAQAASAGFFLLMASDVAAMAPGTNTGAAHPVGGKGEDIEGHLGEKIEQDTSATIRSLARQHGRNVELAEAAVLESRSYTAEEALEQDLVEILAPDIPSLLQQLDGRTVEKGGHDPVVLATAGVQPELRPMTPFRKFLSILAHPEIAYLLMAFGGLGLYMELSNPGAILPGVVGAICLILAFYSLSVLPVNYAGVALILLAIIFFIAEVQVPSFGLLTVGGLIALALGSVMLFKDAAPAIRLGTELIVGSVTTVGLVVGFLSYKAIRVRRTPVQSGREGLLGEQGVARTDLDPEGKVFVHGEIWRARSAGAPIPAGTAVRVSEVRGLALVVEDAEPAVPSPPTETTGPA